ncbi:hypothetical protein AB0L57_00895 [Nocardia sp. NPDC052254]|uniref:hypothetical protein n=1 Tax=Nocardia sp. NPDC052254 TaxID=3155681 RepID=UPI00342F3651
MDPHDRRRMYPRATRDASTSRHGVRAGRDAVDIDTMYGSCWVLSSLSQLDHLYRGRSIDADAQCVIEFAIRWAPFGGADPADLLVAFGVGRRRFLELVREGLRPRQTDNREARWLKQRLLDSLVPGREPGFA